MSEPQDNRPTYEELDAELKEAEREVFFAALRLKAAENREKFARDQIKKWGKAQRCTLDKPES